MPTSTVATVYRTGGGAGSLDAAVAQYWVREALETRYPNLVFRKIVDTSDGWKTVPARTGDIVNWWRMPAATAQTTPLAETAADPEGQSFSAAAVTAQVAAYGGYVIISDQLMDVMIDDPTSSVGQYLMYQAALTEDALIRAACHSGGTANHKDYPVNTTATHTSTVSASNVLTRAYLTALDLRMKENYVPPLMGTGRYGYIAHPRTIKDLRSDTAGGGWLDVSKYSQDEQTRDELRHAYVGVCENFDIWESPLVSSATDGSGSARVYRNIAWGHQAVGGVSIAGSYVKPLKGSKAIIGPKNHPVRMQDLNIQLLISRPGGLSDPLYRRYAIAWKFWTAFKVLEAERVLLHYVAG